MNEIKLAQFEKEYLLIKPQLDVFKDSLLTQIENLIQNEKIALGFPTQNRTKDWNSISNKLENGRYYLKKTVFEMQDLVGYRIILLFNRDVDSVCKLLRDNLNVIKEYNTSERLKDDQFGYSSYHFIVTIPKNWLSVPTFKDFGNYKAEIQIRTLSQHTWAEASKELQYKQEDNIPRPLLRSIGRVSALLETVDLEFDRLLVQRDNYIEKLNKQLKFDVNQVLNIDVLKAILGNSLPPENKIKYDSYSALLKDLFFFDIKDKNRLEKLISDHLEKVIKEDKIIIEKIIKSKKYKTDTYYYNEDIRTKNGVFYSHVGLIRAMMNNEFNKEWEDYNKAMSIEEKSMF